MTYSGALVLQKDACVPSGNETAEFNTTWDNLVLVSRQAGLQHLLPYF